MLVTAVDIEQRCELVEAAARRGAVTLDTADHALAGAGVHEVGQLQRVEPLPSRHGEPERGGGRVEHNEVVAETVVGDHGPVAHPLKEPPQGAFKGRGVFEIAVLQPGQFRDARREPALRSDQRLELFEHAFVGSQHRSDLDDLVLR